MNRKNGTRKSTLMLSLIVCTVLLAAFWSSPALAAAGGTTTVTDASTGIDSASSSQQPVTADIVPEPAQIDDIVQPLSDAVGSQAGSMATEGIPEAAVTEPSDGVSDTSTDTAEAVPAAETGGENTGGDSATCCETDEYLELICGQGTADVYWASMDDYNSNLLSINYRLTNTSTTELYQVRVTDYTATNGVKLDTPLPLSLGDLSPGEVLYFTLKWLLPSKGVTGFQTKISICTDFEPLCEGPECDPDPPCEGPECDPVPPCEGPECDPNPICEGPECDPAPVCEGSGCTPAVIESGISDPAGISAPAVFHASALPSTGFSLTTALILIIGLLLPLSLLVTVASRLVAARRS